ncbi:MAG: methyltransferase [Acidimicrobiales bacterium]
MPDEHIPNMSGERAAAIARWHDDAYVAMKREAGTGQRFTYLGLDLWVPASVQPITGMSHLLGEHVLAVVRPDDHVLDMGTGCGVNALLAASIASRVVGVDTNAAAIEAAVTNAYTNGLADRVEFRHSDVFGEVPESFDLIIFDPQFRWFPARDLLESAITDHGYRTLTTFFDQVASHLRPGGRLLMFFGTSGDLEYFLRLADGAGLSAEVVARRTLTRDALDVEYLTFQMTLAG